MFSYQAANPAERAVFSPPPYKKKKSQETNKRRSDTHLPAMFAARHKTASNI